MNTLKAPEGYIYQSKINKDIKGKLFYLGIKDSIKNYELVKDESKEVIIDVN